MHFNSVTLFIQHSWTEMGFDQGACISPAVTEALASSAVKKYYKTLQLLPGESREYQVDGSRKLGL